MKRASAQSREAWPDQDWPNETKKCSENPAVSTDEPFRFRQYFSVHMRSVVLNTANEKYSIAGSESAEWTGDLFLQSTRTRCIVRATFLRCRLETLRFCGTCDCALLVLFQAIIENLTFSDVESEGARSLADANLIKLCRLSQLCLEYLLHCQEVLERLLILTEQLYIVAFVYAAFH